MKIASVLKRWGAPALGLVLVLFGLGLVIASQPTGYGWFGSPGAFIQLPPLLVVMPTGAAIAFAAGIAILAGWAGYLLGHRSRRSDQVS